MRFYDQYIDEINKLSKKADEIRKRAKRESILQSVSKDNSEDLQENPDNDSTKYAGKDSKQTSVVDLLDCANYFLEQVRKK